MFIVFIYQFFHDIRQIVDIDSMESKLAHDGA